MRRWRVVLALTFLAVLALAGGAAFALQDTRTVLWGIDLVWSPPPQPGGAARVVTIPPGLSAGEIGVLLAEQGLLKEPRAFRLAVNRMGVGDRLQAGEYRLHPGMTVTGLVAALQEGRYRLVRITIPEGRRAEEVADIIAATGVAAQDDLLRLFTQGNFPQLQAERAPGNTLEGFLFPDTYLVPPDYGAEAIVNLLLTTFERKVPPQWQEKAAAQNLSLSQVVTLASIVEREAAVAEERPLIAGVFLNRLREGMPLAADPTIQYALALNPTQRTLFGWWKRDLTLDDLALDSPYNTYRVPGLPPAPICNPGLAAIEAVLTPQGSDYLFFVARPDGTHVFATTFAEHQRNIARIRTLSQP